MSKYNLSELLTEVAGGRIGTLKISARELVDKMDDVEARGIDVDRYDGLSPDGKTYLEFHVHPEGRDEPDASFSVYDFKFGFDPMSPEHSMEEYPFSVGGRGGEALRNAKTLLGAEAYRMEENKEEIKEDKEKDLINALRFQVMTLEKGIIDKDDFINAIEELAFGQRRGPSVNTDDDFEREQRMQMGMREEESIDEADNMEIVTILNNVRKHLVDKFDRRYSKPEFDLYMDSLERDMRRSEKEFDEVKSMSMEDHEINFEDYIADRYDDLAENFKRFI
jgi:hypothetical protein